MKKRCLSLILALILFVACLPAGALAADAEDDFLYLSLGDSIAAGYGLWDAGFDTYDYNHYEMRNNFQNYSSECYTALIANEFGWTRQEALNLGLPGIGSTDLLEIVHGRPSQDLMVYDYPEISEYIQKADLIVLEIGTNNAFGPFQLNVFNNISPKLDKCSSVIRRGTLSYLTTETLGLLFESLRGVYLTLEEIKQLIQILSSSLAPAAELGLTATYKNLPLVIDAILETNPDVDLVLLGYTNPMPLVPSMRNFFQEMNRFAAEVAEEKGIPFVPVPDAQYNLSAHPNAKGHQYISEQLIPVIRSLGY